jgi:AcrR family transcriptional regulator
LKPSNLGPTEKVPVQKRSQKTHQKIIDAARELFAEIGFEQTTTVLIAKKAGVSIGGIYARFNNKMEMFLAILEQNSHDRFNFLKSNIDKIFERKDRSDELFTDFFPALYRTYRINDKLRHELSKFVVMNKEAREIHEYWEKKEHSQLKRFFQYYTNCPSDKDIEATAIILHQATQGLLQYMYQNEDKIDEERIIKLYQQFVFSFLSDLTRSSRRN